MTDPLYLHLLLNHIPITGTAGAALLLLAALWTRSRDLALAGLVALVVVALITIPVFLTGEPAEERVERLPGFSHDAIHEHEEAAKFAVWGMQIAGVLALGTLIATRRRGAVPRKAMIATLVVALWALSVVVRTAALGGDIRHTEVDVSISPASPK
jgi:hypothetical protein